MKNSINFKGLLLSLFIASLAPAVAFAGGSTFQSENRYFFNGGAPTTGASTLIRHAKSIHLRVTATGLSATAAYSAWFIIFNRPENCAGGPGNCVEPDLDIPAVKGAVRNAGGFISGADGSGYFSGTLETGPAPSGMAGFGTLKHGFKAEVHILLLDHGAPVPGTVHAHISTPPGGTPHVFSIFEATK